MTSVMTPSGDAGKTAAVLMRMSRPPKRRMVASSASRMVWRSRMSILTESAAS